MIPAWRRLLLPVVSLRYIVGMSLTLIRCPRNEVNTVKIEWKDDFMIKVKIETGAAVISANREGMLSLAAQLSALADSKIGEHIHYDESNSLETGSSELIIERV